jgi:hypothetical protein
VFCSAISFSFADVRLVRTSHPTQAFKVSSLQDNDSAIAASREFRPAKTMLWGNASYSWWRCSDNDEWQNTFPVRWDCE